MPEVTTVRDAAVPMRRAGMMIHAESKPLAIALNRIVVGTAQGDINYRVRYLRQGRGALMAVRGTLLAHDDYPVQPPRGALIG